MISTEIRSVQAELVRALGRNDGAVLLATVSSAMAGRDSGGSGLRGASSGASGNDATHLDAAVQDLVSADLVALGSDGMLRAGPRGSLLGHAAVASHLGTRVLGRTLDIRASVASTNDVALDLAVAGQSPGVVVAAELQTAGRGRRGRVFDSRPGLGLWTTSVLEAPVDPEAAPRLSLLAGMAVCQAVERLTGVRPGLKWPNDVLVGGRKICGVLVEARSVGEALYPVAGIGLNVHHRAEDFPEAVQASAGSLESTCGGHPQRSVVLAGLLNELESILDQERSGHVNLKDRFAAWDVFADREVTVGTQTGIARGVDEQGRLILETASGLGAIRSGEVSLRAG